MKRCVCAFWVVVAAACSDGGDASAVDARAPGIDAAPLPDAAPVSGDILVDLAAIPGMVSVTEKSTGAPGYRAFELLYEQPVDHDAPSGPRFRQRLALLHRGYDAPVILVTEGYALTQSTLRDDLTALIDANQIVVEHRFFGTSFPDPVDWSKIDIRQAANDHHRITAALKGIYPRRWLNTGASKGGMAAIYQRRFFPDDVYGTIALVAPQSFERDDPRYVPFIENVGSDAACRQKLRDFQRTALSRRSDMLARMSGDFALLGKEQAFEHAVLELPFYFWQYHSLATCGSIPPASATSPEVFGFLNQMSVISDYTDPGIAPYFAYYVQAEHELGYPAINEQNVADLILYPGTLGASYYMPAGVSTSFVSAAMRDIDTWVRAEGQRLLFVYGEYDPWSAGAFELGDAKDSFKLVVPAGNHSADVGKLDSGDRATALDALARWADAPIVVSKPTAEPRRDPLAGERRR